MVKTIYIESDGSLDVYDEDNCRCIHLCGTWENLHFIYECFTTRSQISLHASIRVSNKLNIYFRISNTNEQVKIPISHFKQIVERLKQLDKTIIFDQEDVEN